MAQGATSSKRPGRGGGIPAVFHIVLAALLLLAPAVYNRQPFIFYDTAHYLELGRSILATGHVRLPNLAPPVSAPSAAGPDLPANAAAAAGPDRNMSLSYVGGRSPYYALPLTILTGLTGFWGIAVLQALIGAWLAWLALRTLPERRGVARARFYALVGLLTLASSLPYFVAFAMPDVFAGYALVSVMLLLLQHRSGRGERAALWLILAFSTAVHSTIIPLVGLGLILAIAYFRMAGVSWGDAAYRVSVASTGWLAGVLAGPVFAAACLVVLGDVPRNPPFLMARILADGPGRTYLRDACQRPDAFAICRFRHLPLSNVNDILWSGDPRVGVFSATDFDTRSRLSREQRRFVLAAIAHDPLGTARAAARNALTQLATLDVGRQIGSTKSSWDTLVAKVVPALRQDVVGSRAYQGTMAFWLIDPVQAAATIFAAVFVFLRLSQADFRGAVRLRKQSRDDRDYFGYLATGVGLATILIFNAVMCGILSGPAIRYVGRLTWLLPAFAFMLVCRFGWARGAGRKRA